ncbi:ATP-binding cassette domain-containing protein [Candidatus Berkiella aquae]|uniref:ABC transporter ATP-binding protein/permease n=2 Tax=Candidatus Berkiella aquae TaxID=295108 RepID=A0AAE3HU38_9GAMM|nr:ABC transporter ATP-binding protein [Candidatus Berkiella aquae]MCS5710668.1 ABC transporter ATP-binding protein/permease [Candidatus Berkiella aquae]
MDPQLQINQNLPGKLFSFIWHYLKNKKSYLLFFLFCGLLGAIEMSLSPYLLKVIIDAVARYPENDQLYNALLIPVIIYISIPMVLNIFYRFNSYLQLLLYPEIKSSISKDMFSYLMHHSHTFFQNHFAGSLIKKISNMSDNVESVIRMLFELFIPRIFSILIASITLFAVVQPIFGIFLFVWALSFMSLSYLAAKGSEKISRELSETGAKVDGTMIDSISNVMAVKLYANLPQEISYIDKEIQQVVANDRRLQWRNLKINFGQGTGVTILIGTMILSLIYGRVNGTVSPGDFALVMMISLTFLDGVFRVGSDLQQFSKLIGTCNQALSFVRLPHEIKDAPGSSPIRIKHGEIKFENVNFQYIDNQLLFNSLNVTIHPGQNVGLVGYSGGGKSTFIKLILRLIEPQGGNILIDDQDIQKVALRSLRKQIATIPQDPELFHRTIMENIRFGRSDATDEEVIEAAKKAKCHEFISELPNQYECLVGERGVKLSGGQKQRISIARAFLKQAPILLLDEATSALDSITEDYIKESLHELMINKTTIAIAHRLSTLKDMDRILVFVDGKIVEDGSLETLLQNTNGHFYKLWSSQAEGFIAPDAPTF